MDDNFVIDICILFGYIFYTSWLLVTVKLCIVSGQSPHQLKKTNWISVRNGTSDTTVFPTSNR